MTRAGTARVLAVIGDPVDHSLSPLMHNAAIGALQLDAEYVAVHVQRETLDATMEAFGRAGIVGNVTLPHKRRVFELTAHPTERCRQAEACNTFWWVDDTLHGDNTDVEGVLESLRELDAPTGPWLLIGTGGAARAVALAAADRDVALFVRSRAASRADAFVSWASGLGLEAAVPSEQTTYPVVINATELGLKENDVHPIEPAATRGAAVALDLVYRPGQTMWVRAMRDAGIRALDGRAMLAAQGAAAFERFFPGTPAPRDIMRAAVDRALGA